MDAAGQLQGQASPSPSSSCQARAPSPHSCVPELGFTMGEQVCATTASTPALFPASVFKITAFNELRENQNTVLKDSPSFRSAVRLVSCLSPQIGPGNSFSSSQRPAILNHRSRELSLTGSEQAACSYQGPCSAAGKREQRLDAAFKPGKTSSYSFSLSCLGVSLQPCR